MDYNELQKYYNDTINSIASHKINHAFTLIQRMVKQSTNSDFQNRYENNLTTYQNMLKYAFEYQEDPEKKNVYYRLVKSLLKLTDDIREDILYSKKYKRYYTYKDRLENYFSMNEKETKQLVESIAFEKEIENILSESNLSVDEAISESKSTGNSGMDNIFKYLWLSNEYKKVEYDLVSRILSSEKLPWYDKCLIVSAVTLSALRFFDERKINLLFDFSESGEDEVWQRAYIGLCLVLVFHDKRLHFYKDITNRLKTLQDSPGFIKNIEIFGIQYIWQKESEKIAKKINEEIMPDMIKMKSIIDEKLDLDNIVSSDPAKDKNPDWEDYFKDSPGIYKKMEEIQNLQTQGADIFMGAFAMLKQFPFFNEVSNWFAPFHIQNESVKEIIHELNDDSGFKSIVQAVASTYFLCNSDKYSFCYNLKFVMQTQKPAMMEMFKSELDAMKEMAEDEDKINKNTKNKAIFTQYLQDMYRFYMLYNERSDFENVFNLPVDIYKTNFMKLMTKDSKIIHKIGEIYFNQNYFDKALDIFLTLEKEENSTDLLEKIAYCYQKIGKIDDAIIYYNKAILIDKNQKWKQQQLALCYRKKGDLKNSLQIYMELEKTFPDDLAIQADIGQVYLGLENYEESLKYYFKVEYLAPDNHKVQRPLAWCSFILGKMDMAKKYLEKVIEKEKNKNDYLNLAHINWCMGDRKLAINNYRQALIISKKDIHWFDRAMNEDKPHLLNNGIDIFDFHLMKDYIILE